GRGASSEPQYRHLGIRAAGSRRILRDGQRAHCGIAWEMFMAVDDVRTHAARSMAIIACAALAPCAQAFDKAELQGLWAESMANRYACTSTNRHQRFELAPDGKSLTIRVEHSSRAGTPKEPETIRLSVLRAEDHALVVHFDGHDDAKDPLAGEWRISFLGPGVYRWHLISAHES